MAAAQPVRHALARPVATPASAAAPIARGRARGRLRPAGEAADSERSLAVLVADDNRTNQMVLSKILARAGHDAGLVANGEAALDALDARLFDLVLMDVNMPVLNGIEATKLYRLPPIGTAACRSSPSPPMRPPMPARAARKREWMPPAKPIEPARLIAMIDAMVPDRAVDRRAATPSRSEGAREHFRPSSNLRSIIDVRLHRQVLDRPGGDGRQGIRRRAAAAQFAADAAHRRARPGRGREYRHMPRDSSRDRVHALRSSAANIGARAIYDLCVAWRQIGAERARLHMAPTT